MGFRWSGLLNMYFRSLYTCRSQLERISSILLLSSSNRITLCTVRGVLAWSHKRHLFLVSQYGKMTSSCLFSFYYIRYHVVNVSSWSTTFPNNRFHLRRRAISSFDWTISHLGAGSWGGCGAGRGQVPQVNGASEDHQRVPRSDRRTRINWWSLWSRLVFSALCISYHSWL